jgi:carbonic anhydrase
MPTTDDLLKNNAAYAATFDQALDRPPRPTVAVVACMDARLDVFRVLGAPGRGAGHPHAGGVVTED